MVPPAVRSKLGLGRQRSITPVGLAVHRGGQGALGVTALAVVIMRGARESHPIQMVAGVIALGIATITFAVAAVKRNATEIAVTDRRVLIKSGLLRRSTTELIITKIESVSVSETFLGRLLGYGTVTVRGTGGTPEVFERVADPLEFRRRIQGQIEGSAQARAS